MPTKALSKTRNNFFDLIKTVCILFVVVTHMSWTSQQRMFPLFPIAIDMAVPLFLIISAYLRATKIKNTSVKEFISKKNVIRNLVNTLSAYIITAFIEICLTLVYNYAGNKTYYTFMGSFREFLKWFVTGLSGPGSYYVPILIQIMVYIPILYLPFKKGKEWGLFVSFIINLAYEFLVYFCKMDPSVYRLLVFRYTLILGFGIYLAFQENKKKDMIIGAACLLIGLTYILTNAYIFSFPLFQGWKSTSMFCAPFAYGIVYFGLFRFKQVKYRKYLLFGQASYHIYLTQMVFYEFGGEAIVKTFLVNMASPYLQIFSVIIIVAICFLAGLEFYFVETKIREKMKRIIGRAS